MKGGVPAAPESEDHSDGMTRTGSVVKGIAWMGSSAGIQAVTQLAVLMVLARLVSPSDFGVVTAALVVVGVADVLAQSGISEALVQRPALESRHVDAAFCLAVGLGVVLFLAVFAAAGPFASLFRMPALSPVLRGLAPALPLSAFATVASGLLQRTLRFPLIAKIEISAYVVGYGVVGIGLAFAGYGVWALVIAYVARAAVNCILYLAFAPHPVRLAADRVSLAEVIRFASGITVLRWANFAANQADNLFVGRFLGAAALGVYGRAYQLMVVPASLLGQTADRVLFAAMAQIQDTPDRLASAFLKASRLVAVTVLPVSVASVLLAPEIILLLLGPGWDAAVTPFRILAIVMLPRASFKISVSYARAKGLVYRMALRQVVYAAAVGLGAYAGISYGISGVAWGSAAAVLLNFVLTTHLTVVTSTVRWSQVARTHAFPILMAGVVGVEIFVALYLLRGQSVGPALTVLGSLIVPALSAVAVVRYWPTYLLGPNLVFSAPANGFIAGGGAAHDRLGRPSR